MAVDGLATSRRGYLNQAELAEFANITIDDSDEADDVISQAEEIIDSYVGSQIKFVRTPVEGRASAGGSNSLTLRQEDFNTFYKDYFVGCMIEILGGTGAGQRRRITGSTYAGVISVSENWSTVPDSTSFYRITQLGKFPRHQDVVYYTDTPPEQYYKSIPEAIKRAVAAQVEYIINMGDAFFSTDKSEKTRERIGDYEYENANGSAGVTGLRKMIAPKARLLLRGYVNRVGSFS